MQNNYVQGMMENFQKEELILDEIIKKNEEQKTIIEVKEISFEDFEQNMEEKKVLLRKLGALDREFDSLYEKVKTEIDTANGKIKYQTEIRQIQESVKRVAEKREIIQNQETYNKQLVDKLFQNEKTKIKTGKIGVKAATNYFKTMNQTGFVSPQFLDRKK